MVNQSSDDSDDKIIGIFSDFIKNTNESNARFALRRKLAEDYLGHVLVKVEVGGVRGGSCFNEEDPDLEEYYVDSKTQTDELAQEIQNEFSSVLKQTGFLLDLQNASYTVAARANSIKEYTEHEYYGNSVDYYVYAIDMADVFKATLDSATYRLFQKATVYLMDEPLNSELKERKVKILEQLEDFDKENNKQKEDLKARIDKLQKVYDNFDGNVSELRKDLEQELGEIENKINPQRKKNKP